MRFIYYIKINGYYWIVDDEFYEDKLFRQGTNATTETEAEKYLELYQTDREKFLKSDAVKGCRNSLTF